MLGKNLPFVGLILMAAMFPPVTTRGAAILVANFGSGTIGEYLTTGATVNASLLSGFSRPIGIALGGNNEIFVSYLGGGASGGVGEYSISGSPINPSLISVAGVY